VKGKAALAVAVAVLLSCGGAYLTAPSGSTIVLVVNPDFIPSHGGVSELSAIVTESTGTDVPDGTVVLWTTTLGHVDRETRTVRGIARNRLISDSRSGTATVTAASGADALPPTTTLTPSSTTPSTTPGPTTPGTITPSPTTPTTRPNGTSDSASRFVGSTAAPQASDSQPVRIGNILVENITLRAFPTRITNSNSTHVIATVTDRAGNPVANVPVFFDVLVNKTTDFFESAGAPIYTNNNGEAEDILRTRRTFQGPPIQVVASAAAGGGFKTSQPPLEIPVL
jgi:hypothetical protein